MTMATLTAQQTTWCTSKMTFIIVINITMNPFNRPTKLPTEMK